MADEKTGVEHFSNSVSKLDKDGNPVMSSYVDYDEGEKLVVADEDKDEKRRGRGKTWQGTKDEGETHEDHEELREGRGKTWQGTKDAKAAEKSAAGKAEEKPAVQEEGK